MKVGATKRIRRLGIVAGLMVFALILAACGGAQQNGGQGQQGGQAEGQVIEVDSGEMYFRPSTIEVTQGQPVTLVVRNSGAIVHNISIDEFGVDRDYNPGQTVRVTFTPNRTGEFRIYCDIPGHTQSGMVGTLIVR